MFTRKWIIGSLLLFALTLTWCQHTNTTCEEFEENAKFDPFQIMDSRWRIAYFWSDNVEIRPIIFSIINPRTLNRFRNVVDVLEPNLRPDWNTAVFIMEPKPGVQVVMLYMGTVGAFRGIVKVEERYKPRPNPPPMIKLADLRFNLIDRYMAMMCCEDLTAFVLTRFDETPSTEEECAEIASRFGLRGPGGRSHLYIRNLTHYEL